MSKICNNCKTSNEDDYLFCKNCGTPLENGAYTQSQSDRYNYNNNYYTAYTDDFDGITAEEMSCFIGSNSQGIMPKFSRMQLSNSKLSWCWPLAILSLIFGTFGASFWFFYRKMYKWAVIMLCLAVTLLGIRTALIWPPLKAAVENNSNEILIAMMDENSSNSERAEAMTKALESFTSELQKSPGYALYNYLVRGEQVVSVILLGLFGLYLYKQHCIKKIGVYKQNNTYNEFYNRGIQNMGGVSAGMAVLGVIIYIALKNALVILAAIITNAII